MKYPDGSKIRLQAAIGAEVRKHRLAVGLNRGKLAALVGVSDSTLAKIEDGQQAPSVFVLQKIAFEFDVSLDTLVPVLISEARVA